MLEPLNDHNLRDHLMAFADGELDARQAAAVWAYLAERPNGDALRWLADQKRLTLAARRSLDVAAPQGLRERITELVAADARVVPRTHTSGAWPRRIGTALAMAAALAVAVTITFYASRPPLPSNVVPADLVVGIGRVHAECSRLPKDLHDARVDAIDPRLAEVMKSELGVAADAADAVAPDLTSAGFRLIGAGPCPASKFDTVHLLYRSTRPQNLAAVSLFVQADAGQFPQLKAGTVYRVSSPGSPFPMLAWRTGKAIYFLLADDDRTEANVLQVVRPTAIENIVTVAG